MKVIDLLNKIANGEEFPKQIKYDNEIYTYNNEYQDYELFDRYGHSWLLNTLFDDYSRTKETLDCELEIIEEPKKTVFRFDKDGISMYTVYNNEEIEEDKEIEEVLDIELLGQCDNWLQKRDVNIKSDFELNPYILEAINRNFKGLYHKQCELIKAVNELKKGK